jgi:4-amino-4-deoxy-L-arabinose transferase-like glycosyltransferase
MAAVSDPSSRAPRGDAIYSIVLGLVAFLPRLFVAVAWAREPVWDGHYYHFGAQRIAAGLGYSEDVVVGGHLVWKPWCHYPVGYSALLGAIYKVFGSGLVVAPVANAVIGTLLVVVTHRVARYYLSENRARVAGALVALYPGLIVYSALVMTEPLAALLIMSALLCALHWSKNWVGALSAGAVLGLAVLVRPASLLAAPLIALVQPRPVWKALARGAVATALSFVVVLPWTIRNCRVMDRCALVSTNGGWNLAIGALTKTGRFFTLHAKDGCPVVTGQVEQDRCWAKVGRKVILAHPGAWLEKMPAKLAQTYDHESFAIEYLHEASPADWPDARRAASRDFLTFFDRLLMIVSALGVVAFVDPRRSERRVWIAQLSALAIVGVLGLDGLLSVTHPLYLFALLLPLVAVLPLPGRPEQGAVGRYLIALFAATSLTHAVFFGEDRYHLIMTPALCLLAAAALRRPKSAEAAPNSQT